jgi:hypothetical protein
MGAILQTTKGPMDKEIRSQGYWAEAVYFWKKNLQSRVGYGQDACNREDLMGIGILKKLLKTDDNGSKSKGVT